MKYLIFFLIGINFISAQSTTDFGLKGGLNLTFFKFNEANFGINQNTQSGYYGGVFVNFDIDETLSIQP